MAVRARGVSADPPSPQRTHDGFVGETGRDGPAAAQAAGGGRAVGGGRVRCAPDVHRSSRRRRRPGERA
eukprot:6394460-Prymnesium_polylepis.1